MIVDTVGMRLAKRGQALFWKCADCFALRRTSGSVAGPSVPMAPPALRRQPYYESRSVLFAVAALQCS
eukprot:5253574-Pyramimonas_sp.AAC.1